MAATAAAAASSSRFFFMWATASRYLGPICAQPATKGVCVWVNRACVCVIDCVSLGHSSAAVLEFGAEADAGFLLHILPQVIHELLHLTLRTGILRRLHEVPSPAAEAPAHALPYG